MRNSARATAAAFALTVCLAAGAAAGNPVQIRYLNPSGQTYDTVTISLPTLAPQTVPSACPAGATCNAWVCAPPAVYSGITATATAGGHASPISNQITVTVPRPTACTFDLDRSGSLTVRDFGPFLVDYDRGCWTTADFGLFMTRFGKGSCS